MFRVLFWLVIYCSCLGFVGVHVTYEDLQIDLNNWAERKKKAKMNKSTEECRKDCDVYQDWLQMEVDYVNNMVLAQELRDEIVTLVAGIDKVNNTAVEKIRQLEKEKQDEKELYDKLFLDFVNRGLEIEQLNSGNKELIQQNDGLEDKITGLEKEILRLEDEYVKLLNKTKRLA